MWSHVNIWGSPPPECVHVIYGRPLMFNVWFEGIPLFKVNILSWKIFFDKYFVAGWRNLCMTKMRIFKGMKGRMTSCTHNASVASGAEQPAWIGRAVPWRLILRGRWFRMLMHAHPECLCHPSKRCRGRVLRLCGFLQRQMPLSKALKKRSAIIYTIGSKGLPDTEAN